jgi:hypothetical protein
MTIRTHISQIEYQHLESELRALDDFEQHDEYLKRVDFWTTESDDRNPYLYADLCSVKKATLTGLSLKIRGRIESIAEPTLITVTTPESQTAQTEDLIDPRMMDSAVVTIQDDRGFFIDSFPIINHEITDKINRLSRLYTTFDFVGFIMPRRVLTPARKLKNNVLNFFIFDLLPSESPLQIIKAKKTEIVQTEARVNQHRDSPGSLLNYVKRQLVESIGIRGLDKATQLDHSLDFMILQALSDGYEQARSLSLKLHSLIIGSPAVGKKLLTQAAKELNPVHQEGHPGKLTPAGISGTAILQKGTWHSKPGLIPLAHQGVFIVQDFHSVDNRKKREIMPVLSMVMEDGVSKDTTAARTTHYALTSVHFDINKRSDVQLVEDKTTVQQGLQRFDDIGIPMNVLTRFDFIIDIKRDTVRQLETAKDMYSGSRSSSRFRKPDQQSDIMRQLKVLIAYLRSEIPEVEIPTIISEYAGKKYEMLIEVNRDQLQKLNLLGDFQTRMVNSIDKLVFAIARGDARSTAIKQDVDLAFRFMETKMKFIATLEPFTIPQEWGSSPKAEEIRRRQAFILDRFKGQEVTVRQLYQDHQESYDGPKVTEDTIRADLEKITTKSRHGYFKVPEK